MRINAALRYQLYDKIRPLAIFYFVIYAIHLLINFSITSDSGEVYISGFESASLVFIFIMALASCKETLMLFLQNGISRKTFFVSFLTVIAIVALLMSAVDIINNLIFAQFSNYQSLFGQIYHQGVTIQVTAAGILANFLWNWTVYISAAAFGLFVGCLYFRMNKWQKLTVSIGVPVLLFLVMPVFAALFPDLRIYQSIGRFILFALGVSQGLDPLYAMASSLIAAAVFAYPSFLLVRKAPARE